MSELVSRDKWGARPARAISRDIAPEGITVHWMGSSPWRGDPPEHARCASIWRAIQSLHLDAKGWWDIAYTSGVCPHGVRFEGRGPGVRTGANGSVDANRRSYAVCYLAGEDDPVTDAALAGFLDESGRLGVPILWSHRDWVPTGCPGDELTSWVRHGSPPPSGVVAPAASTPPPPPPLWPTLRRGSRGRAVEDLQRKLNLLSGRGLAVDGIYGPGTERAVRDWQRLCGLVVDGICGPQTWHALNFAAWIRAAR